MSRGVKVGLGDSGPASALSSTIKTSNLYFKIQQLRGGEVECSDSIYVLAVLVRVEKESSVYFFIFYESIIATDQSDTRDTR